MNRAPLVAAMLIATVSLPAPASAQRQTEESAAALRRWVEAVNAHRPGRLDASLALVCGLSYHDRVDLQTAYSLFIRALRGEMVVTRSDIDTRVAQTARDLRSIPGAPMFLERAALLHTDALLFASKYPAPPDDAPPPPPRGARSGSAAAPPLLYNERVTLVRDGELYGDGRGDWNLPFARSLLDVLVRLSPATAKAEAPFVSQWYHAVSAYLFADGNHADAKPHLAHAAELLPDDPHVLFDRGTFAETLGLPVYQTVLDDPAVRGSRNAAEGIPPEARTNGEAERLYQRALAVDPAYVEARVRLARLLEQRGQHDEAAAQIATALDAAPAGVPGFYARIVAGRIASAQGRFEDARRHYRGALESHPNAQSALLGASHAALMLADARETLVPLEHLNAAGAGSDAADPWLIYAMGAGRDVDALFAALWAGFDK